ncbi:hypothetical protein [Methylobacterium sp. 1973]|uniref:hypothetical protein n=1 Tax=Methylobacterium sp. 1973 TaxID=3156421 RepID=UPI0033919182
MRLFMLAAALMALPAPTSSRCRCTCMRGEMKAICSKTDRTVPICRGLCETTIRQERVIVPLAGGRQAFEPAQTTNPCPGGLTTQDLNLDTNPNGTVLGTPS